MSEIRVNNITNRDGTAGPSIAGIPVVDSNSHFVVPTGRTGQRYVDGGENIVRDGLVLYLDAKYSYPGATGTNPDVYTWYDLSGNENHGELKNGVSYSGTNGGSLVFDGVDNYATLPINSSLSPVNVTVESWVSNNNLSQYNSFIGGYGDTAYNGYWLGKGSIYWTFSIGVGGASFKQIQATAISPNTPTHLVGTFDGSVMNFYINGGASLFTFNLTGNIAYSGGVVPYVGNITELDSNRFWTGNIFNYKVYNRALSASEVLQNYEATRSRFQ